MLVRIDDDRITSARRSKAWRTWARFPPGVVTAVGGIDVQPESSGSRSAISWQGIDRAGRRRASDHDGSISPVLSSCSRSLRSMWPVRSMAMLRKGTPSTAERRECVVASEDAATALPG